MIKMKFKFSQPIRTRALLEAVLMSSIAFIGLFAKFSYILVRKDAGEYTISTMFGYRYLSQFLWSLGNEIFTLSAAALLWAASVHIKEKRLSRIFRYISIFCTLSACYFMGWIFVQEFFEGTTEIVMAILFCLAASVLYIMFLMATTNIIRNAEKIAEYLKSKIRMLTDIIILVAPNHVKNQKVWHYEVVEPMLDKLDE